MIALRKHHFLRDVVAMREHADSGVIHGRFHTEPAFGADRANATDRRVSVTGAEAAESAARKTQLEMRSLFHFLEARIVWGGVNHAVHFTGLFAADEARCV